MIGDIELAVRPDAGRLNYRTADQVYVSGFGGSNRGRSWRFR
jgi:hypothetical protein